MANTWDFVRKKISKTFLQKKFTNIFKTEKKIAEIPESQIFF